MTESQLQQKRADAARIQAAAFEPLLNEPNLPDNLREALREQGRKLSTVQREALAARQRIDRFAWVQNGEIASPGDLSTKIDALLNEPDQLAQLPSRVQGLEKALLSGLQLLLKQQRQPSADPAEALSLCEALNRLQECWPANSDLPTALVAVQQLIPAQGFSLLDWIAAFNAANGQRSTPSESSIEALRIVYAGIWRWFWTAPDRYVSEMGNLSVLCDPNDFAPQPASPAMASLCFNMLWHQIAFASQRQQQGWAGSREFIQRHQALLRKVVCPVCDAADCSSLHLLIQGILPSLNQPVDAVYTRLNGGNFPREYDCLKRYFSALRAKSLSEPTTNHQPIAWNWETQLSPMLTEICESHERQNVCVITIPPAAGNGDPVRAEYWDGVSFKLRSDPDQGYFLQLRQVDQSTLGVAAIYDLGSTGDRDYRAGDRRMSVLQRICSADGGEGSPTFSL